MVRQLIRWLRALFGIDGRRPMTVREFFVRLLEDDNLARYYEDRNGYIGWREENGDLTPEDAELLRSGTLAEVEQRLLAEHKSPGPKPLMIVWPPM
jgi:hypothetical protein